MADEFSNIELVSSPARNCIAAVPHASNPNPGSITSKAIRADVAAAVVVRVVDDAADVTFNMAAGEIIPVRVTHVRSVSAGTLHLLY